MKKCKVAAPIYIYYVVTSEQLGMIVNVVNSDIFFVKLKIWVNFYIKKVTSS